MYRNRGRAPRRQRRPRREERERPATTGPKPLPVEESEFPELGIDNGLVAEMAKRGIVTPTKVQEQVITPLLEGRDILCMSETGSGKTISFAIPTIQMTAPGDGPRVLVVAPTRELAKQIAGEYRKFGRQKGVKTVTIYGGVSMGPQIDKLPDSDVIVGTPGRLLDLARQGYLHLENIKYLILDECDRMFDMGFIEDIEQIIYATPKDRQMLLFSATISDHIQNITQRYMRDAVFVKVDPYLLKGKLDQSYYVMERQQKISVLVHLLNTPKRRNNRTLVFCRTKRMTDLVARALRANRINSAAIHGDVSQARREKTLQDFQQGKITVLVATDVAARGLHVEDITLVVNYALPEDLETFIHRVGRTARQGKPGEAIALIAAEDFEFLDPILRHYGDQITKRVLKDVHMVSLYGKGRSRKTFSTKAAVEGDIPLRNKPRRYEQDRASWDMLD